MYIAIMENITITDVNSGNILLTINNCEYKALLKYLPHIKEYIIDDLLQLSSDIMNGESNLTEGIVCLLKLSKKKDIENKIKLKLERLKYKINICRRWIINNQKDNSSDKLSKKLLEMELENIPELITYYKKWRYEYLDKLQYPITLQNGEIMNILKLLHRYSGFIPMQELSYLLKNLKNEYKDKAISDKIYSFILQKFPYEGNFEDILRYIIIHSANNIVCNEMVDVSGIFSNKDGFIGEGRQMLFYNVKSENCIIGDNETIKYIYNSYTTSYIGDDMKCHAVNNTIQIECDDRIFIMDWNSNDIAFYILKDMLYVGCVAINEVNIYKISLSTIKSHILDIPLHYYYDCLNREFDKEVDILIEL
ncbi:Hypothetical protein ORPV_1095 [Orpheovirus IHUMI-LCC2]|uniref:Uncharacterized protein n=1 Tax=Orpheovirus IHUMI-LCC2 TaxID=2023057 RepID=A0A2I2L6B1_9VIRU|nr:Hypothetical protein ORPV_1095 [Orpheovirus IHUMI-LCC2]SNW62999.1 Hypothetical protein ORPV_1095 [Orpheovirus IHUMI-LCC2]